METLVGQSMDVQVVDGEGMPVPGLEVGARYHYPAHAGTWNTAVTDGDGWARFRDDHVEAPSEVCLYVADRPCDTFPFVDGMRITLEL